MIVTDEKGGATEALPEEMRVAMEDSWARGARSIPGEEPVAKVVDTANSDLDEGAIKPDAPLAQRYDLRAFQIKL